jgi:hypothetical protein
MKKIIFGLCILLAGVTAYSKPVAGSKVPVLVKNSFYNDYPNASHVKWETTEAHDYKASFRLDADYGTVYYNERGEFVESDITIDWKDVPLTGRMEIYHLNKKGHVTNVLKIVNQKHEKFYLMDIKNNFKHYEIWLDHEGNLIKS